MPLLSLPLISQWGISANRFRNDCGVACVAMLLEYYAKRDGATVDSLAAETGLSSSDSGLLPAQLVTLAARHGLPTVVLVANLDDLRAAIDDRRPVVALVAYRYITGRLDQVDNVPGQDGHFLLVEGYDDSHFVIDDPDVWEPYLDRGHNVLVPVTELDRAMAEYHYQCVIVEVEKLSEADQIIALAAQAESLMGQIKTLAGQIAPPAPLPGKTMIVVNCTALNVRSSPQIVAGNIVGSLAKGAEIQVEDAPVAGWMRIVYGVYTGDYVSAAYLAPKA